MGKKLNILIFKFALALGGGERFSFILAKKMNEAGGRVKFYTNNSALFKKFKNERIETRKIYWGHEVGARRYLSIYFLFWPFNVVMFSCIFLFNKRNGHKNVVFLQGLNEKIFATSIARFLGYKVFWVEHLSIDSWLTKNHLKNGYLKNSLKTDKIIAVSRLIEKGLIDLGVDSKKIEVIYNGVDSNEFKVLDHTLVENEQKKYGFFKDSKIIGYDGRLHKEKGLDVLINSFSQLTKRFDHLYLLITGDGPERGRLEEQVRRLSLEKRVLFLGHKDDIPLFLNMIDVFVLPSVVRESFGMVLIEAMACGKVVIASNLGGIPEIVVNENNGFLFKPGDEKELSDRLSRVLSDDKLREKVSYNAIATVKNRFTVEIMIKKIKELF